MSRPCAIYREIFSSDNGFYKRRRIWFISFVYSYSYCLFELGCYNKLRYLEILFIFAHSCSILSSLWSCGDEHLYYSSVLEINWNSPLTIMKMYLNFRPYLNAYSLRPYFYYCIFRAIWHRSSCLKKVKNGMALMMSTFSLLIRSWICSLIFK